MEIIISAKDRQAAEANKYASILLEEIDHEKEREERRKAALAKKRDKKKMKKKKKVVDSDHACTEDNGYNICDEYVKDVVNDKDEKDAIEENGNFLNTLVNLSNKNKHLVSKKCMRAADCGIYFEEVELISSHSLITFLESNKNCPQ